jgi:hypothetical protein
MFARLSIPDYVYKSRPVNLAEGQVLEGIVLRLPGRGIHSGTRIFLRTDAGEEVCLPATGRAGWAVLERTLLAEKVAIGDRIAIRFRGWRETADGERRYRDCEVMVLDGSVERAA